MMDSLLANYASSDEDQEQENQQQQKPKRPEKSVDPQKKMKVEDEGEKDFLSKPSRKISDSFPPPKRSLFNSLPPPKSHITQTPFDFKEPSVPIPQPQFKREELDEIPEIRNPKSSSTSLFSSLPQPKSSLFSSLPQPKSGILEAPPILPNMTSSASFDSSSKRVVQFRPPPIVNPISNKAKDEGEDSDEDEKEKQRKKSKESVSTSSVKSFLSSIPAPKNSTTLGSLPSASGTGRRSMLETDASASNLNSVGTMGSDAHVKSSTGYSENKSGDGSSLSYDHSNWNSGSESYANYDGYGAGYDDSVGTGEGVHYLNWNGQTGDYANYGVGYEDYGQYESKWIDGSGSIAVAEGSGLAESGLQVPGKRGRNDAPEHIVEVKQDELLKNRPREDQAKLTGIAFGPAYKPASTKGKPTKLHKRKHQIGSLLYDLRQKEMELAERRSKGFLTKAQTQAKYGW